MTKYLLQLLIALVLFGGICGRLFAEEPFASPAKVTNAALVYWQAFALLPELSDGDTKLLSHLEKDEQPLNKAEPLLAGSRLALGLIRHVKPDTPCRWELIEDGPSTLLPHLSKARLLARLLILKARIDAKSGDRAMALDQLSQALLLARNVDDGVLVQMLVGDSIESLAVDAAQELLPTLDRRSRDRLSEAIVNLPPRATFGKAIMYERDVFAEWLRPIVSDDNEEAREKLKPMGAINDSADMAAILAETREQRTQWFNELLAAYGDIVKASRLPLPNANQEFIRLEQSFSESPNPLIRLFMPASSRARERHMQIDARLAELQTALQDAAKPEGKSS